MTAPWYQPVADEVALFHAAWQARVPVLLRGPTGCGKTRFVEHMAASVRRSDGGTGVPLITVSCHEDLTANDLVGRHLLMHDRTQWHDGPLTRAARCGGICYLDELVEARRDTTVVVHSLTDHRRLLPIEKTGESLTAHPDFLLVVSYNPGYQAVLKDLKPSTRQRFVALDFDYPAIEVEATIVAHESGLGAGPSMRLAQIARRLREMGQAEGRGDGAGDGISTRALIHAAHLMQQGIDARRACAVALAGALGDDADWRAAALDVIDLTWP